MSDSRALGGGSTDDGLPDVPEKPTPSSAGDKGKDRTKTATTRSRDGDHSGKEEKLNIFQRIWKFIQEVIAEMRKVVYPTKDETRTYFIVVIIFVVAIMAFTGILDFLFNKLALLIFA